MRLHRRHSRGRARGLASARATPASARGGSGRHRSPSRPSEADLIGTFGPVEINVPRARLQAGDGATQEWKSASLQSYQRRTRKVETLIAGAYLAGTNTRRVKRAMVTLFKGAIGKDGRDSGARTGNYAHAVLRQIINYAIREELTDTNPAQFEQIFKLTSRDSVLTSTELSALWTTLESAPHAWCGRLRAVGYRPAALPFNAPAGRRSHWN